MVKWLLAASSLLSCNGAPLIAAHRGGMDSGNPENTLPAFEHAATVGAHFLELDVRATRDGTLVVLHDASVDRTTNGHGAVHDLDLAALQRLDAGDGTGVPTLADVLEQSRPSAVELLFDVKPAPGLDHAALIAEVRRHLRLDRVLFGVRSLEAHARLAAADPGLRFIGLVPRRASIDGFLGAGVEAIRLWPGWIERDRDLIAHIHDAGARVWVTTGDAPIADLVELANLGVDVLLTDHPAAAVAALHCD